MANQYTKAEEAGIGPGDPEWPKQAETRREHPEEVRARIRIGKLIGVLESIAEDENATKAERSNAAKILLDKSLSSLSSIDQTVREEPVTGEALEARLEAICRAQPEVLQRILGKIAAEKANPVSQVDQEQAA